MDIEPRAGNVLLKGYIEVPAARMKSVCDALPLHIELTRAEPGCIQFDVVPCETAPGKFRVSEVFKDQAAFDAHQERAGASQWARVTQGIARHYKIETF